MLVRLAYDYPDDIFLHFSFTIISVRENYQANCKTWKVNGQFEFGKIDPSKVSVLEGNDNEEVQWWYKGEVRSRIFHSEVVSIVHHFN